MDVFDRAKRFSDFLGFHVRLFFCASVAQIAAAIPVSRMLSNWKAGVAYSPLSNPLELLVMVLFAGYAFVIYVFILRSGWSYISSREFPSGTKALAKVSLIGIFSIVETLSIIAILMFSTLQILNAFKIEWADAECTINAYLSQTNYPFTPAKPAHCP